MPNESTARTHWEGNLQSGHGSVTLASKTCDDMTVSWKARTEGAAEATTPEELIAAAHSACFSMALANLLSGDGHTPDSLETDAVVTFGKTDEGFRIGRVELRVHGAVPGMSAEDFAVAAERAKRDCPVSRALSDDIEVTVDSRLL